jgi:fermentation-respiration switch protein FrsA (DUF1100 family)
MRRILLALCVIMLLIFAAGAVLAEGALHPPRLRRSCETASLAQSVAHASGALVRQVTLQTPDGVTLKAWWLTPPQPTNHAVMVCHGVADSAFGSLGFALLFLTRGDSVLVPESRGHGESGGYVTYGVLEAGDTVLWTRWMRDQGATHINGLGNSLGGAILLQSLPRGAAFESVVAEGSYASFEEVARDRVSWVLPHWAAALLVKEGILYIRVRYGVDLSTASPEIAVRQVQIPILLIHGAADSKTSPHHSEEIAQANPQHIKLWIVPGAKHVGAYAAAPREFEKQVLAWTVN